MMFKPFRVGIAALGTAAALSHTAGESARAAPTLAAVPAGDQVAIFAGGCFGGMEGVF